MSRNRTITIAGREWAHLGNTYVGTAGVQRRTGVRFVPHVSRVEDGWQVKIKRLPGAEVMWTSAEPYRDTAMKRADEALGHICLKGYAP